MGLMKRIEATRRRKAVQFAIEKRNGRRELREQLAKAEDGGILIHAQLEKAGA